MLVMLAAGGGALAMFGFMREVPGLMWAGGVLGGLGLVAAMLFPLVAVLVAVLWRSGDS